MEEFWRMCGKVNAKSRGEKLQAANKIRIDLDNFQAANSNLLAIKIQILKKGPQASPFC